MLGTLNLEEKRYPAQHGNLKPSPFLFSIAFSSLVDSCEGNEYETLLILLHNHVLMAPFM